MDLFAGAKKICDTKKKTSNNKMNNNKAPAAFLLSSSSSCRCCWLVAAALGAKNLSSARLPAVGSTRVRSARQPHGDARPAMHERSHVALAAQVCLLSARPAPLLKEARRCFWGAPPPSSLVKALRKSFSSLVPAFRQKATSQARV